MSGVVGGGDGSGDRQSKTDKDRKIGHRRVNDEGLTTYKKVQANQLTGCIQMGIRHAIGFQFKAEERDLLMQDFQIVETHIFPRSGGEKTPAHNYTDFKFQTYAPLAFRKFLNLFRINKEDFMVSIRQKLCWLYFVFTGFN